MPKGYPKSDGQKIGDKFDKAYRVMKRDKKAAKADRKCGKGGCQCAGKCTCGK
jgi:hypothetical protein